MTRIRGRSEEGYVMITALIALAVMALLAAAAISQANAALRIADQAVRSEQALYMANAGVEMVLARARNAPLNEEGEPDPQIEENVPYTYTMELEPGLHGTYVVVVTRPGTGVLRIHATGTVGETSRVVTAELPLPWEEDGEGGEGGGEPPLPTALLFANGDIDLGKEAQVCGDLYAGGNMKLGKETEVWNQTGSQESESDCEAILGTGKAVAAGEITVEEDVKIYGGSCDRTDYGPCGSPPQVYTWPAPDWNTLKATASRWWVRPEDAAFCTDKPPGTCQTLSGGSLTLKGASSYGHEILYVDGNLRIDEEDEVHLSGSVTFAVTGKITVHKEAKLRCAEEATCTVGLIAGDDVILETEAEIWAWLLAEGEIDIGEEAKVYGRLIAGSIRGEKELFLHPPLSAAWPPGFPGAGGEPAPPPPAGYSGWTQ